MEPKNLLFIFSDEHTREITGCYGNDFIRTPHIDRLAERGTTFDSAYTNCPICVPARASLATGRYVHQIRLWDNAFGYAGDPPGWGSRLIERGHRVSAIGKLHYRSADDPTGWSEEIDTLHIVAGKGDVAGAIRRNMGERRTARFLAEQAGKGESTYVRYDTSTAEHACQWLGERAASPDDKPWVLFVGFVLPHFPLIAPPAYYDMYPEAKMPWPRLYAEHERSTHPVIKALADVQTYDRYFDAATVRVARSAYFGMTSYLDACVGRVVDALDAAGLAADTRIVYTTDHGDNIGHRGLWGKSNMYQESASIPMVIAGPDVPAGHRVSTPVTLVDVHQTALECAGVALTDEEEHDMPGHSLWRIAQGEESDRVAFGEYHAIGATTGFFMIRDGRWKFVYYVGHPPQLFDLEADPEETTDLGESPEHADVRASLEAKLREIVDPEAADAQAFADQDALIEREGGAAAVLARGDFGYTPAPGEKPQFG